VYMENKKLTKSEQEKIRGLLLAKSGLTVPMVAKKHRVSKQFAYEALRGMYASETANAIRSYIAERIGSTVDELWLKCDQN